MKDSCNSKEYFLLVQNLCNLFISIRAFPLLLQVRNWYLYVMVFSNFPSINFMPNNRHVRLLRSNIIIAYER